MVDGRTDFGVMATGQVAGLIDDLPRCDELIERIISQAAEILAGFAGLEGARTCEMQDDGSLSCDSEGDRR